MVKSGLDHEVAAKYTHPHVSHYRLAAHLGMALTLFTFTVRNGLYYLLKPDRVSIECERRVFSKCNVLFFLFRLWLQVPIVF